MRVNPLCSPGSSPTPPPAGACCGRGALPGKAAAPRVFRAAAEQLLPGGRDPPGAPNPGAQGSNSGPCPDAWTPCMSLFGKPAFAEALKSLISGRIALCVGQVGLKSNDKVLIKADGGWTQTREKASRTRGQRPWRCRRLLRAGGRGLGRPSLRPESHPQAGNETCSSDQACGSVCAAQRAVHGPSAHTAFSLSPLIITSWCASEGFPLLPEDAM